MRTLLALWVVVLAAGCASFDGRGLVPGVATAAQVEAQMGRPAERLVKPDGSTVLYFTRYPGGRHNFAVTLGPDGLMRGIEQTLTQANIDKLMAGTMTAKQVSELFGPPDPYTRTYLPLKERDVWEYRWYDAGDKRILWVQFSKDGILREVINTHDFEADEPTGGGAMP